MEEEMKEESIGKMDRIVIFDNLSVLTVLGGKKICQAVVFLTG